MYKLTFLLIFGIQFQLIGQTSVYHPFPDSNAIWNVYAHSYDPGPPFPCDEVGQYSYYMNGDTLINALVYHRIFVPFIDTTLAQPFSCFGQYPNTGYIGSIRQDTVSKQVWVILRDSSNERLLYDFSLNIGDTLHTINFDGSEVDFPILTIDSILIDGNFRKTYINNAVSIIEGIGSNRGLFETGSSGFSSSWQLTCFQQNGNSIYPSSGTTCNLITHTNELSKLNSKLLIYPNPFDEFCTVYYSNFESSESTEIIIYNSEGKLLRKEPMTSNRTIFHRNSMAAGLYLFQIVNKKEIVSNRVSIY